MLRKPVFSILYLAFLVPVSNQVVWNKAVCSTAEGRGRSDLYCKGLSSGWSTAVQVAPSLVVSLVDLLKVKLLQVMGIAVGRQRIRVVLIPACTKEVISKQQLPTEDKVNVYRVVGFTPSLLDKPFSN